MFPTKTFYGTGDLLKSKVSTADTQCTIPVLSRGHGWVAHMTSNLSCYLIGNTRLINLFIALTIDMPFEICPPDLVYMWTLTENVTCLGRFIIRI